MGVGGGWTTIRENKKTTEGQFPGDGKKMNIQLF